MIWIRAEHLDFSYWARVDFAPTLKFYGVSPDFALRDGDEVIQLERWI